MSVYGKERECWRERVGERESASVCVCERESVREVKSVCE